MVGPMFKPENWLDRVFEIGIIGKGLNGAAELIGGLLLLFLTPARIHHVVAAVTQGELSEDSGDFVATHLLHTANGLTGTHCCSARSTSWRTASSRWRW